MSVEERKHMGPIITTIFDAMRIRDTRFSGEMAGAITMMKGWCGLENSEGTQFKEPRREPERMDAMARLAAGVADEFNNINRILKARGAAIEDLL